MTATQGDSYMNLGNVLLRLGRITEEQLSAAVEEQKRLGGGDGRNPLLGAILVDQGACSDDDVKDALAHQEATRPPSLNGDKMDDAWERFRKAREGLNGARRDLRTTTQMMKVFEG